MLLHFALFLLCTCAGALIGFIYARVVFGSGVPTENPGPGGVECTCDHRPPPSGPEVG